MDTKNTENTPGCNTRSRAWCFTYNNPPKDISDLIKYFSTGEYLFQTEIGEEGTEHLQGVIRWKNDKKFSTLKNWNKNIHWSMCKKWKASLIYCSKEDTSTGERWSNIREYKPLKDSIIGKELYDWQKWVKELYEDVEPDERTINWIYDEEGNKGKTTFVRHMCIHHKDILYVSGSSKDIKCGIVKHLESKNIRMVIFGFTRSVEDYVSYQAIEEIKDAIFFSGKYESGMCIYDYCHVVCIANFKPDKEKLSKDRWNIIKL